MHGFWRYCVLILLFALSAATAATQINANNYDIYIGDLNNSSGPWALPVKRHLPQR